MHYYVDGYNLIFRTLAAGESLQQRRELLISELNTKIELLKLLTTVVFDSHYQKNEATLHHYRSLEIIYTNEKETADDYIIKALKHESNKKRVTVVTSDQHLAWRARREGANTESAEEYLAWLQRRYRNKVQHARKEAEPPPIQKISLPKLLPDPNEKTIEVKIQSEFDFYMEQFGGFDNKKVEPQTPYESDFDRWLREFDK
jgi:hypothetical protein